MLSEIEKLDYGMRVRSQLCNKVKFIEWVMQLVENKMIEKEKSFVK